MMIQRILNWWFRSRLTRKQRRSAWIEALREGDYRQAHTVLKGDPQCCCLGVLADQYTKEEGAQ